MGKLIAFNMISLDGFFEGKNKELDWHRVDSEFNDFAIEQLNSADTLVFGRVTYELMSSYWTTKEAIEGDPLIAEKMNSLPKIVFSKTIDKTNWQNTRFFKDNIEEIIKKQKAGSDKNIFVFGSANLSETLIELSLIDEYRMMVAPVVLGQGHTLFSGIKNRINLKLKSAKAFKSGNLLLQYVPESNQ